MLPFKVERQQSNGKVRVVIRGELDMETGPRAEEELRRAEDGRPPVLVLDLREAIESCIRQSEHFTTFRVLSFYIIWQHSGSPTPADKLDLKPRGSDDVSSRIHALEPLSTSLAPKHELTRDRIFLRFSYAPWKRRPTQPRDHV